MTLDRRTYTVEVLQVDAATGTADVCTAPAMEPITVDLDVLSPLATSHEKSSQPPLMLFNVGDAVEFPHEGRDEFGEIVEVDDARNLAVVMVIPSEEEVTVCQDELKKVLPDDLAYEQECDGEEPLLDPDEGFATAKPAPSSSAADAMARLTLPETDTGLDGHSPSNRLHSGS